MRALHAAALSLACGCRERAPVHDAAPIAAETTLAADATDEVLFLDLAGRVRRGAGVAAVPAQSRRVVAIEGPDGPGGSVWIADVSTPAPSWTARRGTLAGLERRGLAALPPGEAARADFPPVDLAVDPPPEPAGVVVYGATWCAPCADARAWLDAHEVAYRYRNIEVETDAAYDAAALCASHDIPADRVPVIDLAGKLVIGFDPARLATILGEPI